MHFLILLAVIKYVSRVEKLLQLREHNLPNVKDLCNFLFNSSKQSKDNPKNDPNRSFFLEPSSSNCDLYNW